MSISTQNSRLIATGIAIASGLLLANPSFAQTVKTAANHTLKHTVIHKTTAKPNTAQPTVHQSAEKTAQASTKSLTPGLYK